MAKLILMLDDHVLKEYPLNQERMSIGRRGDNHIVIDNPAISGVHAYITTIGSDSFLEDANSTNGTFINGKSVKKQVLNDGDSIEIGRYRLQYNNLTKPVVKQPVFKNSALLAAEAGKPPHTQPPSLQSLLQQHKKELAPEEVSTAIQKPIIAIKPPPAVNTVLAVKTSTDIGRLRIIGDTTKPDSEIILSKSLTTLGKPGVQVALVTKRENGYFVSHVEGQDLVRVNNNPLNVQAYALNPHDILELAGIKMEFLIG